jgi:hypothetical protein
LFNFKKSEYLDSIYYADLFKIEGKVWMIMGCGKSTAARIASNKEEDADIARDGVALIEKAKKLFGRYDVGGTGAHTDPGSALHALHQIDFVAFCLNQQETLEAFGDKPKSIISTTAEIMARLSVVNPYPASLARHLCTSEEFAFYEDPKCRESRFLEHISSTGFSNFLLIPFMPSTEEKAALYVEHSRVS